MAVSAFPESGQDAPWLENAVLKQRFRLLVLPVATGGSGFVLEYVYEPFAGENVVPAHFHMTIEERFEILSGRARYRIGKGEATAGPGDVVVMPPGFVHVHPWSDSNEPLHVRQTGIVSPPDRAGVEASIQAALTILGLARDGKVNRQGLPSLLQLSVLIAPTIPATYIGGIPRGLQRLLFNGLSGIARALGYRQKYEQYASLVNGQLQLPKA
jgi:mannose-6-phosphate isomerase-like protein (cupin superfamily)